MKFYLSSYKVGDEGKKLLKLAPKGNTKVAYIPNALDFTGDLARRNKSEENDIGDLERLEFSVERIDLRQYFHKSKELEEKLRGFGVIWVRGGNEFVLRQAMKISGLDLIIKKFFEEKLNIVYGGYSAGACILGPTLKGNELVDDVNQRPYHDWQETIWEGIGILDYCIAPHYDSSHPESGAINDLIKYYTNHNIPYKTIKDGEVIIIK